MTRVIGLISGTSVDGIDAVLVEIRGRDVDLQVREIAAQTHPYAPELRSRILAACRGDAFSMAELAELDDAIAAAFAQTALSLPQDSDPVKLIGSHGQTVYHRPKTPDRLGYSLQLGRGIEIARLTGIPTVSNFRAADIAVGGHGAPLVPRIDACLFSHPRETRCVQNIGGIGNLTYLPARGEGNAPVGTGVMGWDTGPGNTLLDLAISQLTDGAKSYDENGEMAATGSPRADLVERWLQHEFFRISPPKSTGREEFGWDFLQQCLEDARDFALDDADLLATLTEFTAASIVLSYDRFLPKMPDRVLLCGGGSRNLYLKRRLRDRLEQSGQTIAISTVDDFGVSSDFKEAIAFAVLAYWRWLEIPGNLPSVTGANQPVLLGEMPVPK